MIDFFEFSNEMCCLADQRGYFTRVNRAWTTTLGWSAAELTSRPFLDFVHPDDLAATIREASLLQSGTHETISFENRYRCRDGSYCWLAWRSILEPHTRQIVATARDITDHKLQAEALRRSEERFRMLATQAPIGIAQADADGSVYFANSKWCELAGVTPQAALGFAWKDLVHPDDLPALIDHWQSSLRAGTGMPAYEFRFLHAGGDFRWVSSSSALLKDALGNIIGQIASMQDITERKAAEERLRWREAQLTGILDNTSAVVYLKDADGRYLLMNRRFQTLFQHLGDSILGKTDREFFPAEIAETFQDSDARVWREQAPVYFEETAPHTDGPHTYRSIKFPVRDDAGHMIALGGISTDISDLKQAHEALKTQRDLLRSLIQVQETERQVLCHEFHDGLIQYAFGSLMLLESCRNNPQDPENASRIDTAIGSLRRGIEDGRRVIRGIRLAVLDDSGLEAAMEDLVGQFESPEFHVTSKCDPEIGRLPESTQTTVYRVVQEALNNARKHSGTDVVRIELTKANGELHLEVLDFGSGFDVAAARQKGFGLLGMTERVRLLGGEFLIRREPDSGTRISVRLPIPATSETVEQPGD